MATQDFTWDFFISYAGPDEHVAKQLYALLIERGRRVFLNTVALPLGADWLKALPQEQRKSRMTILLISEHTEHAYFQREEFQEGIELMREDSDRHEVVPVVLGEVKGKFGWRGLNGLYCRDLSELPQIAEKLIGRTSWQNYGDLLNIDGYSVAYIPLFNDDWKAKVLELTMGNVRIDRKMMKNELPVKFRATRVASVFENDPSCGLVAYDLRGGLSLAFSETSYKDYLISNEHLDDPLPDDPTRTFRDCFGTLVRDNENGYLQPFDLTNICGVGVFVLSGDNDILVAKHSEKSHVYPGRLTFSSSGTMKWGAYPHPFTEVLRKCFQEIKHQANPNELRLVAFGADARKLYFQFGFIERAKDSALDIIRRCGENGVEMQRVDFRPEPIVESLIKNCWEPAAEAALLTICISEYGVDRVMRALNSHRAEWSKREMRDEWDLRASQPGYLADMSVRYPPDQLEQESRKYVNAILRFLGEDIVNKDVLEMGAGTGRITMRLVSQAKSVTCLDLCEKMIQRNRARMGSKVRTVKYIVKFGQEYTTPHKHDAALCSLVMIHNVNDSDFFGLVRKMCECADVIFVCEDVTPNRPTSPHTHLRTEEELRSAFGSQGYQVDRKREFSLFGDKLVFLKFVKGPARLEINNERRSDSFSTKNRSRQSAARHTQRHEAR